MAKNKGKNKAHNQNNPGTGGKATGTTGTQNSGKPGGKGKPAPDSESAAYQAYLAALAKVNRLKHKIKKHPGDDSKLRDKLDAAKEALKGSSKYTSEGELLPAADPEALSGEQITDIAVTQGQKTRDLATIARDYADLQNQTQYDLMTNELDRQQGVQQTDYDMAGRGLAMSSPRDAELFDIDATAALRRNYLQTNLQTAAIDAYTQSSAINNAFSQYMIGQAGISQENANEANANRGWATAPETTHFQPPGHGHGNPNQGHGHGNGGGGHGNGGGGHGNAAGTGSSGGTGNAAGTGGTGTTPAYRRGLV